MSTPSPKTFEDLSKKSLLKRCRLEHAGMCFTCHDRLSSVDRADAMERAEEGGGRKEGRKEKLRVCGGCEIARYCSKGCQSKAWKKGDGLRMTHKEEVSGGRGALIDRMETGDIEH